MKKFSVLIFFLFASVGNAQDHFAGLSTSSRVGIINSAINPAELNNMSKKFEINAIGFSLSVTNNKIGFSDLTSDTDIETLLFKGSEPVNLRIDSEIYGLGLAIKHKKWGLAITSKANGKLAIIDVDTKLGDDNIFSSDAVKYETLTDFFLFA
jgi:hypothetical protein